MTVLPKPFIKIRGAVLEKSADKITTLCNFNKDKLLEIDLTEKIVWCGNNETLLSTLWKRRKFTLKLFWQKFRQNIVFTNKYY